MRALRDKAGRVAGLELFESELCAKLDADPSQLRAWAELIPAHGEAVHPDRETVEPTYRASAATLDRWEQYAKILKTGVTVKQVRELEARDRQGGKFVEMYALLAEECPEGVTAHMLRSYCVLFLYQNRAGKTLMPSELAQVAGISEASAKRHVMWLQTVGLLTLGRSPARWEFKFVPKALSRYYPS